MVYEKANSVGTEIIDAPSWLHKFIIGRKGTKIRDLTKDMPKVTTMCFLFCIKLTESVFTLWEWLSTLTFICFIKVHVEFADKDKIKIEGPPEEVAKVADVLRPLVADMVRNMVSTEINVDIKYHKHIIGKAGANSKFSLSSILHLFSLVFFAYICFSLLF